MPCVSLQRMPQKFQEKSSDLETLLLELGFLCENSDASAPDSLLEPETFTTVTRDKHKDPAQRGHPRERDTAGLQRGLAARKGRREAARGRHRHELRQQHRL